jgi:hypothetical protein
VDYTNAYQSLPEQLAEQYKNLNLENHCYLRIALDNSFQTQWNKVLKSPAYKHLNNNQLEEVNSLLKQYQKDKNLLLKHNKKSLSWRKAQTDDQLRLF